MKITIEQWELQQAIEKAKKILRKSAMPILESVLLTANKNNNITLTATNLESSIIINLSGNFGSVEESGAITIDKSNFKLIKKLNGSLCISDDGNTVQILGNRELKFTQHDVSKFPEIKTEVNHKAFTIKENEFKDSLKIKTFISKEKSRPIMCTCCINRNRIIAIDGFRLAKINLNIDNKCDKDILIPAQSITELDKILDRNNTEELKFEYFSEGEGERETLKYLRITGSGYQYITKLVGGTYFKVDDIIPTEFGISINIKKDILMDSLEFAKEVLSRAKLPVLPVVFDIAKDFKICGNSIDKQFTETILENIDITEQCYVKIGFNPNYLIDALKLLPDDMVNLCFKGSNIAPLVITGRETDNETYMILPVRIPEQ